MRQLFNSAIIKLTLAYTAILLLVSLIFSISFYQVSIRELDANFNAQTQRIEGRPGLFQNIEDRVSFLHERRQELAESKDKLWGRLVLVNLLMLFGSSLLSYYLAKRTLQPIEQAHDAQSRFTADASHELRTPLASMRAEIEVLLRSKKISKADYQQLLSSNLEELHKLTGLSDALLKLARRDEGVQESFSSINLGVLITSIKKTLSATIKDKKIHFDAKIPKNYHVSGDPQAVKEMLLILVENALKYTPSKGKVNVTARKRGRNIVVEVADTGIGIEASKLPHIFERFYRADSSRGSSKNGYGLGLAIASQIAQMHEAQISVASKVGKGTTFKVVFCKTSFKKK